MADKKKTETKNLSRRDFLKATGGAAALAGIGATGLVLSQKEAYATEFPQKWDSAVDVLVIGSGFAGLAAAIEAKNAGSSVFVLEKMRVPGGNSIINGGVMAVAGSYIQAEKGIKDTPDLMYEDMMKAGLYLNYPELTRMVADQSNPTFRWCIDYLGVGFKGLLHMGGHTVARSCATSTYSGSAIVNKELAKLKEMGVKVETGAYLEKIFRAENGRILGVQAREGYLFPKKGSGKVTTIKTNKALVMATGGFSNDVSFRMAQDPKLIEKVMSTNQPGATAEGLKGNVMEWV